MMSTIAKGRKRRIICALITLLCLADVAEGKMRLVPRGKKNKNKKNLGKPQKKRKNGTQILLKPRKKEPTTLKLEATIGENEMGQKMLLLTESSAAAVSNAMQSSHAEVEQKAKQGTNTEVQQGSKQSTNTVVMQEAKKTAKKETQQVELKMSEQEEPSEQQVLFYDPAELKTAAGEIPVPKRVFDADGNEVDIAGKEAVLVPPPHGPEDGKKHPPPKDDESSSSSSTTTTTTTSSSTNSKEEETLSPPQPQDQMIIISTVATMALLVGALSARRLRSRQFLSFCIENESLEDELAYDAAYTTQSTVGASSFYAGAGYDTFGGSKYGGDLRWRGDLEKFDV